MKSLLIVLTIASTNFANAETKVACLDRTATNITNHANSIMSQYQQLLNEEGVIIGQLPQRAEMKYNPSAGSRVPFPQIATFDTFGPSIQLIDAYRAQYSKSIGKEIALYNEAIAEFNKCLAAK